MIKVFMLYADAFAENICKLANQEVLQGKFLVYSLTDLSINQK